MIDLRLHIDYQVYRDTWKQMKYNYTYVIPKGTNHIPTVRFAELRPRVVRPSFKHKYIDLGFYFPMYYIATC